MRIFVLSNYLPYATVSYVLKGLEKLGHEITLIGSRRSGYPKSWIHLNDGEDIRQIFKKLEEPDLLLFIETHTGTKFFPDNIHKIPVKTALWAIDNHLNFRWHKEFASLFDYTFFAQLAFLPWAKHFSLRAFWLPLACDPDIHRAHRLNKEYDVVFVGKLFKKRVKFFHFLKKNIPDIKIGIFENVYLEEMARAYSMGRIGLNLPIRKDINMRTFEIPSCGLLLLSPQLKGMETLFPEGSFVSYRKNNLTHLVKEILENPLKYEKISRKGEEVVRKEHTYEKRMMQLLEIIEKEEPRRKKSQIHLALFYGHRIARNRRKNLYYLFSALKREPFYSIYYLLKYFIFYIVEIFRKSFDKWPH